jgi:predicted dienelactone hydrolase
VRQRPLSKIVVAGHSLGGLTALLVNQSDPHVKGAILRREKSGLEASAVYGAIFRVHRLAVSLQATEHVALSDWIWLAKDAVQTGPMGPQKTMSAVRDYVATFLDRTLRGEPADPLLSGGSPNYPDAKVTLQDQALCGKQ